MKIIHTADWHLGKNLEGHSRLPEQVLFAEDFIRICQEERPDLILIAGDIYDSYNPSAAAEKLFYETLKKLSRGGQCVTVIISGNHDNPDRLMASGPLARDHGIIMAGKPMSAPDPGKYGQAEITESMPGLIRLKIRDEEADILLLPFPSEKRLGEAMGDISADDRTQAQAYADSLAALFKERASHFRDGVIHLAVSHLFVMQSEEGGSERSISLGGSYLVDPAVFPDSIDYTALGHIHKPQTVPGHPNIRYSGSPIHFSLKETSFDKMVLAVEAFPGEPCKIRSIPLPVYKPIECWHCPGVEEAIDRCRAESGRDCFVYLEVETDRYIYEEEIKQMKQAKADILSIIPIIKNASEEEEVRSGPMEEASFEDLVRDYYRKKFQRDISEETMDLLMKIRGDQF